MAEKLPIAFLAGLVSVVTPCVLPLVPGYLSAVSAVEIDRLGERGVGRRIVIASVPFILGFTAVFVALGAGAAAIGSVVRQAAADQDRRVRARRDRARRSSASCRGPSAPSRPGSCSGRGDAARTRCSAAPSRCAPRRASARCSRRSSCSRRAPGRSCAGSSCSSPTRSGSAPRSCSPASRSRTRCGRSAGYATTTRSSAGVRRGPRRARPTAVLRARLVAPGRARPGVHADRPRHALAGRAAAPTSSPRWRGSNPDEAA